MPFQSGEIYFVREQDRTGGQTSFVKIGLVRETEGRDSFSRLLEHQTGNPRKLVLDKTQIVHTNAVDLVEAQLHRLYAKHRVSGEWFEFADESLVSQAVAKAESLGVETAELVKIYEAAEALKQKESSESPLPSSPEAIELADQLATAKAQYKVCADLDADILDLIEVAAAEGADVTKVASTVIRKYSPKFMKAEFEAAHPDLWAKYQVAVAKWSQSFLLKAKVPSDPSLGEEFSRQIDSVKAAIAAVTSHDLIPNLNESILILRQLRGIAEWNEGIAEARLKLLVDTAEGIEGICTWKRFEKVTQEFDEGRFAAENPELAKTFMSEPETKEYIKATQTKA